MLGLTRDERTGTVRPSVDSQEIRMIRFRSRPSHRLALVVLLALAGCASTGLSIDDYSDGAVSDGAVLDGSERDGSLVTDGSVVPFDGSGRDSGTLIGDGGVIAVDSGVIGFDGGVVITDGGVITIDSGVRDGGVIGFDGGVVITDGGVIAIDSGVPDSGVRDGGVITIDSGVRDGGVITIDSGTRDGGVITIDSGTRDAGGTRGVVGSGCSGDAACSGVTGGMCITSLGGFLTLPGGYCSASCTTSAMCGAGATCLSLGFGGGAGQCVATCATSADCRVSEGYACQAIPFGGVGRVCVPPFGGGGRDGGIPPIPFDLGSPIPFDLGGPIPSGDASIPPIPFDLGGLPLPG